METVHEKVKLKNGMNGQKGSWRVVKITCDIPTFQTIHEKPNSQVAKLFIKSKIQLNLSLISLKFN